MICDNLSSRFNFSTCLRSLLSFVISVSNLRLLCDMADSPTPNPVPISLSFLPLYLWQTWSAAFFAICGFSPNILSTAVRISAIVFVLDNSFSAGTFRSF